MSTAQQIGNSNSSSIGNVIRPVVNPLMIGMNSVLNQMPASVQGAVSYGIFVSENPSIDEKVCEVAGKVVALTFLFKERIEGIVALRGEGWSGLDWKKNLPDDEHDRMPQNLAERMFTFHVAPSAMNNTIQFKVVVLPQNNRGTERWQKGENFVLELKQFGHLIPVTIEVDLTK